MPRDAARTQALGMSVRKLDAVDLEVRCDRLGLSRGGGGDVLVPLLGEDVVVRPGSWDVVTGAGEAVHPDERLLVLRYLCFERRLTPEGTLISFRELPGGQFYYGPFEARTSGMLVSRFGRDLDSLRAALASVGYPTAGMGDVSARIAGLGAVELAMVYHGSDEEFGPSATVLFGDAARHALSTEDAAVLASRMCLRIMLAAPSRSR